MLKKAAIKISLEEPDKKLLEMIAFMKKIGTVKVFLIHVRSKKSFTEHEEVEKLLEKKCAEIRENGLEAEYVIRNGRVSEVMVEVADELKADYIAIFWKSKGLLSQTLLGSIDSDIIRLSNIPVFIYNPKILRPVVELKSVLYATDFKPTSSVIKEYLKSKRFQADTLYLLNVGHRAPDPMTEEKRISEVKKNLQDIADSCAESYKHIELLTAYGIVYRQIVKKARKNKVDLIVVGKSEHLDALGQLIGSTAELLPHKSPCSVFIIPGVCQLPEVEEDIE